MLPLREVCATIKWDLFQICMAGLDQYLKNQHNLPNEQAKEESSPAQM